MHELKVNALSLLHCLSAQTKPHNAQKLEVFSVTHLPKTAVGLWQCALKFSHVIDSEASDSLRVV